GSDPDIPVNTPTFSLDAGAPSGAAIDATTGLFTWTPTEAQGPGTYSITVRVTDNGSPVLTDSQTFSVTVNEVNRPPVLAAVANQTVNVGTPLSLTLSATDPDLPANVLTYSAVGLPTGATLDPVTGVFTWTPSAAQGGGTYTIRFRVTDDGGLFDEKTATFTVNPVSGSLELRIAGPADAVRGQERDYALNVTGAASGTVFTFTLNWGDGSPLQTVTGV